MHWEPHRQAGRLRSSWFTLGLTGHPLVDEISIRSLMEGFELTINDKKAAIKDGRYLLDSIPAVNLTSSDLLGLHTVALRFDVEILSHVIYTAILYASLYKDHVRNASQAAPDAFFASIFLHGAKRAATKEKPVNPVARMNVRRTPLR